MTERTHPMVVQGYQGSLEDLGRDIARMRYDAGAVVLRAWAREIYSQARKDRKRGRPQLAGLLFDFYHGLMHAKESADKAWRLCRRHSKDELAKTPEVRLT
jgi:hypothetical protein